MVLNTGVARPIDLGDVAVDAFGLARLLACLAESSLALTRWAVIEIIE